MTGRLTRSLAFAAAALLSVLPARVQAQEMGRFRVLVPDFFPTEGARKNFGEDAAKELRELLNGLATHQPIERGDINDQLREFKMKMEELDCLKTRQLASQVNAQVALCASYAVQGGQNVLQNIEFWDMATGEAMAVEAVNVPEKDGQEQAAQHIFQAFDRMVQLARLQQFCGEYAQSQQWEDALRNCDQALEINPSAVATRYRKARILYEQAQAAEGDAKADLYQQSYEELGKVLEVNEFHEEALQLAGFVALQLNDQVAGRGHYSRYLEINPNADAVRLKIAYDMNQAGDPEGAMLLIKVGLEHAPENPDLLEYYGSYAFEAGRIKNQEARMSGADAEMPANVRAFFADAIDAFEKAYAIRGDSMAVGHLRNIIAAHMQLGDPAQAETVARRVLTTHGNEAQIWSFLADALQAQGKLDEAITTLAKVEEIDPEYQNLYVRQGNWLLAAGRVEDAAPLFQKAVDRGQDASTVARIILADAHTNGVRKDNYAHALRGIGVAKRFQVNADVKAELDFWHGYSLYQTAIQTQEAQTLESANRSKPMFEQAKGLFQASRSYATRQNLNLAQFLQASDTYIEIQDAIIKRGR